MIEITRNITPVTITVTREGKEVILQPIISKNNGGFDGIVDGGTA